MHLHGGVNDLNLSVFGLLGGSRALNIDAWYPLKKFLLFSSTFRHNPCVISTKMYGYLRCHIFVSIIPSLTTGVWYSQRCMDGSRRKQTVYAIVEMQQAEMQGLLASICGTRKSAAFNRVHIGPQNWSSSSFHLLTQNVMLLTTWRTGSLESSFRYKVHIARVGWERSLQQGLHW